jgi:hypothetical protein
METRSLGILSAALWLLACALTVSLDLDMQRPDGARLVVWMVWALGLMAALQVTGALRRRALAAEQDSDEWRARWGPEVGPHRAALARLVWAIEEATKGTGGYRGCVIDAPDLLVRAERLTKIERTRATP